MDPEIARLHREGTCPFFNAAHKAKSLGVDENIFKLEDSTQIPIEEAVDIFRTISMDDGLSGNFFFCNKKSLVCFSDDTVASFFIFCFVREN